MDLANNIFFISAGSYLPVTVVAAIVLFTTKELLEGIRRRRANGRKRKAVRRVVANEIERNRYRIKVLRDCIHYIGKSFGEPSWAITVEIDGLGERFFRVMVATELTARFPIPSIHSQAISSNLMLMAEIDRRNFEDALLVIDATVEIEHVSNTMIQLISNKEIDMYLDGFEEYATRVLLQSENVLESFYKRITGRELVDSRVR